MSSVIDLSVGHIRLTQPHQPFIVDPSASYGSAGGMEQLRSALAAMHSVPMDCIVVTAGSSLGITSLLASKRPRLLLLPRPYFPSFTRMAKLLGLEYEFYSAICARGRANIYSAVAAMRANPHSCLIWNYPHNPTGALDSESNRTVLRSVAAETECELLLDCVYSDLVFSEYDAPSGVPLELEARVYSLSKSFALAGERIGYVIASPARCREVARAHWALAMSPPVGSQSIAFHVLTSESHRVPELIGQLRDHRELAMKILGASPYVVCKPPDGGIFLWIEAPAVGLPSAAIAKICQRMGLLVESGSSFGVDMPPTLRVSLAVEREDLERGLAILLKVARRLSERPQGNGN
jgi:aspartate/methionine/tyrosine aminotransferase